MSPVRAPLHVPQQGPYGEGSFISKANRLFIHLYPPVSPVKSPTAKNGDYVWSPPTESHVDGRPTYNGVCPGSSRGCKRGYVKLYLRHEFYTIIFKIEHQLHADSLHQPTALFPELRQPGVKLTTHLYLFRG